MFALWLLLVEPWTRLYQRQLFIAGVTIALVLLLAALILAWVRRLNKRRAAFKLNAGDQLAQFRVLYERGELSADEFQRLRSLLTERMQRELAAQQAPPDIASAPAVVQVERPKDNGPAGSNGTPSTPGN